MRPERPDLSLDPLRVTQQQFALLAGRLTSTRAVGLVCPHVLNPNAHSPQAGQCLQRVEILLAVPAMPAARVAPDRADQPDLFVVAQCWLAQPAAPGDVLDG